MTLTICCTLLYVFDLTSLNKQCRPRWDAANAASHQGLHCLPLIQLFLDTTLGSKLYLYPDIRSMWRYIVFAFPFVRSSIRHGQSFCVKVYKTSYFFEDPLMDFIHIWHDGRYRSKVFISTIPTLGVTLGSRSQKFHKKVKVFCV